MRITAYLAVLAAFVYLMWFLIPTQCVGGCF